jgi:hypothetical protein
VGDVELPRHVHGHRVARKHGGRLGIRQPAAVPRAISRQRGERVGGVADTVDVKRQAGGARRLKQEIMQLVAALLVAPVADPDHARARLLGGGGTEQARVGRLVPGEGARSPAVVAIDPRQRPAKGEHAVIARDVEGVDRGGVADRAVVRVVEQQPEPSAGGALAPDRGH